MASLDYIFQGAPATGTAAGAIPSPGTKLAPSVGLDVTNNVGYLNVGSGWVPQVPAALASASATAQTADIATLLTFAVPAHMSGLYRIASYIQVTTVAATSSTLPAVRFSYTDPEASNAFANVSLSATNAGNLLSTSAQGSQMFSAKGGTNITANTNGYASNVAATMQYAIRLRIEYLG